MITHSSRRWLRVCILTAILLSLLFWPVSMRVASQPMDRPAADTLAPMGAAYRVLVIPAAAFRPDGSAINYFFPFSSGYIRGIDGSPDCFMAPVYLPRYAKIDIIYASIYDNDADAGDNLYIDLDRVSNYTGTENYMGGVITNDASTSPNIEVYSDATINWPDVVYPDYSYYLGACLDSFSTRIYSVRIWYYLNLNFMPFVKK